MVIQISVDCNEDVATALSNSMNIFIGSAGELHFFDGVQPATCEDPDDGNDLVICGMNAVAAWQSASGLTITANSITAGVVSTAGVATYWRIKSGGGVVVLQGSVSMGSADIVLSNTNLNVTDTVNMLSLVLTVEPP